MSWLDRLGTRASGRLDQGQIVTVMSAKGGSGKTVTATNLAVLLARQPDTTICLVDADLQFGDVCLVLQLEPKVHCRERSGRVTSTRHSADRVDPHRSPDPD